MSKIGVMVERWKQRARDDGGSDLWYLKYSLGSGVFKYLQFAGGECVGFDSPHVLDAD